MIQNAINEICSDYTGRLVIKRVTCDNLHEIEYGVDILRLLICFTGAASMNLNDRSCDIASNEILICLPGDCLTNLKSVDMFSGYFVVIPPALEGLAVIRLQGWRMLTDIRKAHPYPLTGEDMVLLRSYISLFEYRLSDLSLSGSNDSTVSILFTLFAIDIIGMIKRGIADVSIPAFSAGEALFGKFISALQAYFPQKRTVAYYAGVLCVTPKYLSTICKSVYGKTAAAIINEMLLVEIQNRLMDCAKSIKTIAYELDFSTQSAFGKYVKARLGVSPLQLRARHGSGII